MHKYNFAVPVLPGKDGHLPSRAYAGDDAGYEESRRRMGVTLERVFIMPTPMGDAVIAYVEADKDFAAGAEALATSDVPADLRFREAIQETHGVDLNDQSTAPPPPELAADWVDPDVKDRRTGLAFLGPLKPGQTDAFRNFIREALHIRTDEQTASRRALGITHETVFINASPMGDMAVIYLEGSDPAEGNRRFAASQSPYDRWFKNEVSKYFMEGVDFTQPVPPIETIWDRTLAPAVT